MQHNVTMHSKSITITKYKKNNLSVECRHVKSTVVTTVAYLNVLPREITRSPDNMALLLTLLWTIIVQTYKIKKKQFLKAQQDVYDKCTHV